MTAGHRQGWVGVDNGGGARPTEREDEQEEERGADEEARC